VFAKTIIADTNIKRMVFINAETVDSKEENVNGGVQMSCSEKREFGAILPVTWALVFQ